MIVDSNILIYGSKPDNVALRDYLQQQEIVCISAITALEVLGFHRITPSEKAMAEAIVEAVEWLAITDEVILEAIRLRQQRKRSVGDAIIAATALIHKLPLLTNNEADFIDVVGLIVIPMHTIQS